MPSPISKGIDPMTPDRPTLEEMAASCERIALTHDACFRLLARGSAQEKASAELLAREAACLRAAATALRSPVAPVAWMPIESAPKDRTPRTVFVPVEDAIGYVTFARWKEEYGDGHTEPVMQAGWRDPNWDVIRPTHWLPLPPPPAREIADGRGKEATVTRRTGRLGMWHSGMSR